MLPMFSKQHHPLGFGRSLMTGSSNRFARQADLVPREKLAVLDVTVIGVGAMRHQVSLQLASLGVRRLRLVDFDVVELTNITTQGYLLDDVGEAKVDATARAISAVDATIALECVQDRYRPTITTGDA